MAGLDSISPALGGPTWMVSRQEGAARAMEKAVPEKAPPPADPPRPLADLPYLIPLGPQLGGMLDLFG